MWASATTAFPRTHRAARSRAIIGTARSIGGAPRDIQMRHIGNCLKCDPAHGRGIADALGIELDAVARKDVA